MKSVHILVFDGFADWEPAHALAELRRTGGFGVWSVGFTGDPVRSMGGLRVMPDGALYSVAPADVALFILPGGDLWEDESAYPRAELETLLHQLVAAHVPIAAICGATLAVARAGLLDTRPHTSNAPEYIAKHASAYTGRDRYQASLAVRDTGVITASGLGSVDFAREIFEELGVFPPKVRPIWYNAFKHGTLPQAHKEKQAAGSA
jgi:putative intracellular protease/amidase